jgi:hypothetical protein
MEGWAVNYGFRSDKKESIKSIHNVSPRKQLDNGREESERSKTGGDRGRTQS